MAHTTSDEAPSSDIQAVTRVGQICALFGPDTPDLAATDVAARLGLNRTTAYRYCTSMVAAGILDRGARKGTFVPGGLMLQLGIYALSRRPVVDLAPPLLAQLAASTQMTAVLSLWGVRGPIVTVVEEDRTHAARVTVAAGTQLGADAAQTLMFLAHRGDRMGIEAVTAQMDVAQRSVLDAAVYTARRTGYSVAELPGGVVGVAAPVFDDSGIAATVALLGANSRRDLSASSPTISALLDTAAALTAALSKDSPSLTTVPTYDELERSEPPGSSWSHFGAGDEFGTINFLTPERVRAAADEVRSGRQFGLDFPLTAFEPYPTGTRAPLRHTLFSSNPWHRDDWVDSFYLQSSSQIDALRHIGHPQHGFYNGLAPDDNDPSSSRLGIHTWAESGIVGRGVLLDVPRFFERSGRPYDPSQTLAIDADLLDQISRDQRVEWRPGDMLLLRTGWAHWYLGHAPDVRATLPWRQAPGLAQRRSVLRWLWDHQIAMVAADNLAVEADPVVESDFRHPDDVVPERGVDHSGMLHRPLIALLGMALGELWNLEPLAADCDQDGRYSFFLTCKPLYLIGGVGSPPNAIAMK